MKNRSVLKLGCFADVHIYDDESLKQTVARLANIIKKYAPDLLICLGDSFDNAELCRKYGQHFYDKCLALHPRWLFCYGNHDGEGFEDGYLRYNKIFGTAQDIIDIKGHRVLSFADMHNAREAKAFSLHNTAPGDIVCCHGSQPQEHIEKLSKKGARLILSGHKHFYHIQRSAHAGCEQITIPPFNFGGMNGEAAGAAIITLDNTRLDFQWVENHLSPFPMNKKIHQDNAGPFSEYAYSDAHFDGTPDKWLICPPVRKGQWEWRGGPSYMECRNGAELMWAKSYGSSWVDNCPSTLLEYNDRNFLIMGTTWLGREKGLGVKGLASLLVADAVTGEELYKLPIVGVSTPPTVADGIMYVVGQWREIMAAELTSGKILWRQRSQTVPDNMSWYDNHVGGGWSVCPAAVGKHVWTVNARGDLFGYNRMTGSLVFTYPQAIPLNSRPSCTYAPHLGFCSRKYDTEKTPSGDIIFIFNGTRVNDTSGNLLQ